MRNILAATVIVQCLNHVVVADSPTVEIAAGLLHGGVCTNNSGASYFKSIPYAQPPVGNLRFAPPQPYNQNYAGGSLDATQRAPSCIQFGTNFVEEGKISEDCLYLDIWAPINATKDSALPVRTWIYGGSNTAGGISDPLYDGCNVPDTGALMVSINYRLGPLGFLALEESGFGGNQAIQDILLGLQWIQDNIAAFGGNPKKVMLYGQSAGAADAFVVSTLPQAPNLISSVILQSGGGRDSLLKDHAEALGQSYARALNCSISDPTCLRSVSTAALNDTWTTLPLLNLRPLGAIAINSIDEFTFASYVDGKIVPVQPSKAGVTVPAIFGNTARDAALFAGAQFSNSPDGPTDQDYTTALVENFGNAAPIIEKYYPISAFNASPVPAFSAIVATLTAASYLCPVYRGANTAVAKGIPVWTYLFDHSPKCAWIPGISQEELPILGPTHTSEIPFVFNQTVDLPLPNGNCSMSSDEVAIAAFMVTAWTTFAATQKPTTDPAQWPAFGGPNNTLGLTIVNTTIPGKIDYSACQLWDEIEAMELAAANNGSYAGSIEANATSSSSASGTSSTSTAATASMSSYTGAGVSQSIPFQSVVAIFGLVVACINSYD